jgi:protein gp37
MTKIEWARETWNPIVGCSFASPGCTNCYAMGMANRLTAMSDRHERDTGEPGPLAHYRGTVEKSGREGRPVWTGTLAFAETAILKPFQWKSARRVFVNSMGDLFHEDAPWQWIDRG